MSAHHLKMRHCGLELVALSLSLVFLPNLQGRQLLLPDIVKALEVVLNPRATSEAGSSSQLLLALLLEPVQGSPLRTHTLSITRWRRCPLTRTACICVDTS